MFNQSLSGLTRYALIQGVPLPQEMSSKPDGQIKSHQLMCSQDPSLGQNHFNTPMVTAV